MNPTTPSGENDHHALAGEKITRAVAKYPIHRLPVNDRKNIGAPRPSKRNGNHQRAAINIWSGKKVPSRRMAPSNSTTEETGPDGNMVKKPCGAVKGFSVSVEPLAVTPMLRGVDVRNSSLRMGSGLANITPDRWAGSSRRLTIPIDDWVTPARTRISYDATFVIVVAAATSARSRMGNLFGMRTVGYYRLFKFRGESGVGLV